ncbi:hypothetical protein K458DRAFT_411261 [Lentithecium fluviatile CBS 122367]|uniref:Uncharacterized protein n=1 Tax=Lentithecium fluviatile CBS 122367 TaxID=1168545 RepID=A0A6G1JM79_9PLEO|nr:hypothetical protein K458DRAFT_411261 [Lentithecium fluviatile CBS 122367]
MYGGKDGHRKLGNERKHRDAGRLTPLLSDDDVRYKKRSKLDDSDDDKDHESRRKRIQRDGQREHRSRRHRDQEQDSRRERRRSGDRSDDDERSLRRSKHSRRHRDRDRRHEHENKDKERLSQREFSRGRHRRRKSHSRSRSRTQSPSPRSGIHHKSSRRRPRSPSPRPAARIPHKHRSGGKDTHADKHAERISPSLASDSDPLEAIVGPLPPPAKPAVRARGRGALKADSMGTDSRFSSTYDASTDVRLDSDVDDDWGDALEALKDRQRWLSKGADRLRDAGFSEELVNKWEKGGDMGEEDVVWTPKGHSREWDKGKVVDEDGDVDLKADWGRLK